MRCIRSSLLLAVIVALHLGGAARASETWAEFQRIAAERFGEDGAAAAAFLAAHRPAQDDAIELDLLVENLEYALRARETFPWARTLDRDRFHNDVLPYAVFDETRERWRPAMYDRAAALVAECRTATEAAQALNRALFNEINVHYNTGRKRPNQSPQESIDQGRATCTGLSILLIDACRAVGVPARAAGIAAWPGSGGNHTWVEVWDGVWGFLGADEYDARGLNHGWFAGRAQKAIADDPAHAIWASSWRETDARFPMVWARDGGAVPAVNVTHRYAPTAPGAVTADRCYVRVWSLRDARVVATVAATPTGDGAAVPSVETRAGRADLNDAPCLALTPHAAYDLAVTVDGATRTTSLTAQRAGERMLDLSWDDLALTKADAEALVAERAAQRAAEIAETRSADLDAGIVRHGDHELRILERRFGTAEPGARALWISMHGGGGAPKRVNDGQWQNQIKLYEPEEGYYVAPRAPTDTWNLWHRAHVDDLFDRLIETYVATRGVDPNRVYLMGYSAGGDGVYQVAPRMADRFAAASMMAGHPNEASPLGLRNLPFAIFMGGRDAAYQRNEVARRWGARLDELEAGDPDGYAHRLTIYPECGHWMEGKDREALPWMAAYSRNPWPERIVWFQDDVVHRRFYWLACDDPALATGATIRAAVSGQTITIESTDVTTVTLRLRDALIDLDQPIRVVRGDTTLFEGRVDRTAAAIRQSLETRADPATAATALLRVTWTP